MNKIKWYINRLKAMSLMEMVWRVKQKVLQSQEKRMYKSVKVSVDKL